MSVSRIKDNFKNIYKRKDFHYIMLEPSNVS